MKFVDRIEEARRLKEALARKKVSLVVYGLRRLEKSTLITRVLLDSDVYFFADRSKEQYQRVLLVKMMAQLFPDFNKVDYPDWESLFRVANYRAGRWFTLCLDDFLYLVEQCLQLPSVLQKLLDEKQLKYNIVLCSTEHDVRAFFDSGAPLYGRADVMLKLGPIRLPYLQSALKFSDTETIEEYAVWGGVPRYWELREFNASLIVALWQNILSVSGTLYEEPIKFFQDDIKDVVKTSH